ncbi:MAG: hypothetical protein H6R04_628 [Burkholderiaceae bacterium]|nr:hypothetical protein [Burkholderiaceae bacterium]
MLPLHPQPLSDEVLSSWMVRLAFANGYPLHTFYAALLRHKEPIWNRDIDRHPSPSLINLLSQQTRQQPDALQAMTLSAYNGVVFGNMPMIGNAPWILPVGVFHRTRRRAGMQFCPICLQLDVIPYFRRRWRLAFYAMCEHHFCVMHDGCPRCHSSIAFHRHGVGLKKSIPENALRLCHHCMFDLRWSKPKYLNWPDPHSWIQLRSMLNFFDDGVWAVGSCTLPVGVPFFQGLRALARMIYGRHGHHLRHQLSKELGIPVAERFSAKNIEFEFLCPEDRLVLMLTTFWLLENWPARFVSTCKAVRFTRSRIAEVPTLLPYWLARIADEHLNYRPYWPNEDEVDSAVTYLLSRGQPITHHSLGNALGLSRESAITAWNLWRAQ